MLRDHFPDYLIVPERQYGKQHRRGPDLTVIDTESDTLIIVESKGRKLRAETRLVMDRKNLLTNLDDAFKAIERGPRKIQDMLDDFVEYQDIRSVLDKTKKFDWIFVVILSESTMIGELARHLAESDANHILHSFPHKYCIMSLDQFEQGAQLCRNSNQGLGDFLRRYWEQSGELRISGTAADRIAAQEFDDSKSFGAKFYDRMIITGAVTRPCSEPGVYPSRSFTSNPATD